MPAEQKEKPKRSWFITVLLAAVVLLSAGYVYYFFFGQPESRAGAAGGGEQGSQPLYQHALESITVNLADPGLRRYLRTKIVLEYADKRLGKELQEKSYRVQDAVISVLRSKKTDELQDDNALRRELLQAVNNVLTQGKVSALYFQELVIQ
ncbi:MAG: flagellar protein FliL [Clostridia bacterium]|nr:flagellar protein FliL [Clostridia bacterium]